MIHFFVHHKFNKYWLFFRVRMWLWSGVANCDQTDRVTAVWDVETVCKLETTSWNFFAPSVLLIKTPRPKAGLSETLTPHVRDPGHVLPEEWRCGRAEGENLPRECQPLRNQTETSQKCLQMVMGWGGLSRGWKPPSGSFILASCPVLWILPCFMFQLAQLWGWRTAASAVRTTDVSRRCLFLWLVYFRIHQRVSLFQFPMLPDRSLRGSVSIRAGLSPTTSSNRKQERETT